MIVAGDMIELSEVVDLCTAYLVKELEASNAVGILRFASDHNCKDLKTSARNYVNENFVSVSGEDEFKLLPREMIMELLSSEYLRVDCEYQVS